MTEPNRQRGLQRVVTELSADAKVDPAQAGFAVVDEGWDKAFNTAAAGFAAIGDKIGKLADHAAAVEGAETGRLAGLDPEFRPTKNLTIRGEAFDKAGLDTYRAKTQVTLEADLAGAYEKYRGDPAKLQQVLGEKRRAWIDQTLPEVRPDVELQLQRSSLAFMRQATRDQAERIAHEQRASLQDELATRLKGLHQKAFGLGLDPTADQALAGELADIGAALRRRGPNGQPLVQPEQAKLLVRNAAEEITTARILGAFDRVPSLEGKAAFIKEMEDDFGKSRGVSAVYDLKSFRQVTGMLEGELRRARVEQNTSTAKVDAEVTAVARMAEKGFAPAPEQMAALRSRVAATGTAETAGALAEAEDLLHFTGAVRRLKPAELDGWIERERDRMQAEGTSPREVRKFGLAETLLDTMRKELSQDQLAWAEKVGLATIVPLDFSSPEKTAVTVQARVVQADAVAREYGRDPVYFKLDERKALQTISERGGDELVAVASTLATGFGDRAQAAFKELGKDQAGKMALLGMLVHQLPNPNGKPPAIVTDAANGIALKKVEGFKPLAPSGKDQRAAAHDVLFDVMKDMGASEAPALDLADRVYEVRARRAGKTTFEPELWKQGLKEIIGEHTVGGETYGGIVYQGWWSGSNRIILPPELKQDGWRDAIRMIKPEDLAAAGLGLPVGQDGKPVSLDRVKAGTLVQVANGRYAVSTGDPSTPGGERWVFRDKPGQKFEIDFGKLSPILRKRRPDLFAGGGQ